MTANLPPLHDSAWGAFPPEDLLPEAVRSVAEKLGSLRSKAFDAREAEVAARLRIDQVEADQIMAAADRLAAGESTAVDSKPVDKARAAHEQAIRDVHATQHALARVEAEVAAVYSANADDAKSLVDANIERTREAYEAALDVLMAARRAHLDAVAVKHFTRQALLPLSTRGRRGGRTPDAGYYGGSQVISPGDYQRFKAEIEPPMQIISVPAAGSEDLNGPLDRADQPADAW